MFFAFVVVEMGVFSFDEAVIKLHPFVEVVLAHGVAEVWTCLPPVDLVLVVFADVAEDAPVHFAEVWPVVPDVVSGEAGHVGVAGESITHCRHHNVWEILIENWCSVFLELGFKHCSVFLSFR